jgi:hypothetical protein
LGTETKAERIGSRGNEGKRTRLVLYLFRSMIMDYIDVKYERRMEGKTSKEKMETEKETGG